MHTSHTGPSPHRWIAIVPNALSAARLGAAVALPCSTVVWWPPLIIAAAASDALDGYIARRFNASSWQGGLLDAVADKAFTLSVLVTFAATDRLAWWHLPLLVGRDITVGSIAGYALARRRWDAFGAMPPRPLGKATTATLFTLFVIVAIEATHPLPRHELVERIMLGVAMCTSVLAALDYWLEFHRVRQRDMST